MSSPVSNASSTDIIARPRFEPIFANRPEFSASDPFGMLPYNRRIRMTKDFVLEWDNQERALAVYFW